MGPIYYWCDVRQQAVQLLEQALGQEGKGRGEEGGVHGVHGVSAANH